MRPARSACVAAQRCCVEAQVAIGRADGMRLHEIVAVGLGGSIPVCLAQLAGLLQNGKESPRLFT